MEECISMARVAVDLGHLAELMAEGYAVGLGTVLAHLAISATFRAIKSVMGFGF
jgi:hypothetical protein